MDVGRSHLIVVLVATASIVKMSLTLPTLTQMHQKAQSNSEEELQIEIITDSDIINDDVFLL
jgi:hypothetical protein